MIVKKEKYTVIEQTNSNMTVYKVTGILLKYKIYVDEIGRPHTKDGKPIVDLFTYIKEKLMSQSKKVAIIDAYKLALLHSGTELNNNYDIKI